MEKKDLKENKVSWALQGLVVLQAQKEKKVIMDLMVPWGIQVKVEFKG
jgi:hypothetical protein